MFSVGVSDHFLVAHSLADPFFGPAQRLHGATYVVEVEVRAAVLGAHQVVMDLGSLKTIVRQALAPLEYSNLDEHPAFPGCSSTTERLAQYLAGVVADAVGALPADGRPVKPALLRVRLVESPTAWAAYERPIP